MKPKLIHTNNAPAAIGPYSQGVVVDGWLFTAGQIPLDPNTGELVKGDIQTQTRRVLENLKAVLDASGSGFSQVVKATVYLTDMSTFGPMNEIYREFFGETKPARSAVAVTSLPKGANIEIDLVARIAS